MKGKSRIGLYFVALRFITDALFIPFVVIVAYGLKFKVGWVLQRVFMLPIGRIYEYAQIEPYFEVMQIILVLWLITFYFVGMYQPFKSIMSEVDELIKVIKGISVATLEIMAVSFIYEPFPGSRFVMLYTWLLGIVVIFSARFLIHKIELYFLKKGIGTVPLLIIGADSNGQDLLERVVLYPTLGFHYVGTLDDNAPDYCHYPLRDKLKIIGKPDEYRKVVAGYQIQHIFVTKPDLSSEYMLALSQFCEQNRIELAILSLYDHSLMGYVSLANFDGMPFMVQHRYTFRLGHLFKRGFDVFCALLSVLLMMPFLLAIGFFIKLVSFRGPVFYSQDRVGRHGRIFKMIKFRTMVPDAEKGSGPIMVDPEQETRYIPLGRFLRRFSLDELPQLINVLKGDMSLVGPRPERPFFVEQFSREIPNYQLRHRVLGGLTGWAQIHGRSVLTDRPEHKLRYDLYYIQNWSFVFDIKIIFKTFFLVLKGEEAY